MQVSLPVTSSDAVTIFKGQLSRALSSPVTFTVPAGTKIAGIAITGTLTLTPGALGQSSGSVTATLPAVLGGGTGTLTFDDGDRWDLEQRPDIRAQGQLHATLLAHEPHPGLQRAGHLEDRRHGVDRGATSTAFSGNLVFSKNVLTSGSLTVSSISLAGMVTISNLNVSYAGGSWTGSATIKQASQGATVAIATNGSTITSASIKTGAVPLFGLINVESFDLEYSGSSWSLAVASTLSGGGTASATLKVAGGVITSASLALTKFALASTVDIASATIAYAASAPNSPCWASRDRSGAAPGRSNCPRRPP